MIHAFTASTVHPLRNTLRLHRIVGMSTHTASAPNRAIADAIDDAAKKRTKRRIGRIERAERLITAAKRVKSIFHDTRSRLLEILPPSRYLDASLRRLQLAEESAANALRDDVEEVTPPGAE